jgi:hypothetical protein
MLSSASVWAQTGAPIAADAPKPELIGEGTISTVDDEFGGSTTDDWIFIVRGWWMESMRPQRILAPTSTGGNLESGSPDRA